MFWLFAQNSNFFTDFNYFVKTGFNLWKFITYGLYPFFVVFVQIMSKKHYSGNAFNNTSGSTLLLILDNLRLATITKKMHETSMMQNLTGAGELFF